VVLAIIPLESRFLPSTAIFFPDDPKLIANAGPHSSKRDGDVLTVTLRRDKNRTEPITRLRGVLVSEQGWSPSGTPLAVHVDTSPGEAASGAPLGSTTTRPIHTQSTSSADVGFITAVIFALLGGFILNLMPCVFPVLSIKILSFIEQSNHDRKKIKLHGLLFALGVIVSFWILAGAMLIVRAGGAQLGWGFQLQSPPFVATMIVVFSALGVMFLSELTFGQRIQTIAGRARIPTSYLGSFLNGALATAVATPCTAPFMSTSLAATISLPASLSLVIFTALGVGMSVPYLILALRPSLVQRLPRPGAWMDIFKQLMAFPLFGTAIWLLRVFARQMGVSIQSVSPITNLLWGLLLLGFGVWLGVRAPQARRALSRAFVITFALCALCGGGTLLLRGATATPPRADTASSAVYIDSHGLEWLPYSEQRLTDLTLQGRNIYVDFTAEWCITCQTNKLVVFNSQDVLDLLRSKEVVLMRADWTSHDPAITAALASFGKNGVPLNILIRKGDRTKAHIMPNILTANVVRDALQTLP
jgi:thiol:disulfide interchange protein DsbD